MAKKIVNMVELKKRLKELSSDILDSSIIKDNKIPFNHEKELYRVKMPTQKDLVLAKDYEDEVKIELLQKKSTISRKKLKKLLKKNQGIDIDKMEVEKEKIIADIKDVYLSLAGTQDIEENRLELFLNKIEKLKDELQDLSLEIIQHMAPCIENKIEVAYIRFLTSRCTEKNEESEWVNVWKDQEEFDKDDTDFPMFAKLYFSRLYTSTRAS